MTAAEMVAVKNISVETGFPMALACATALGGGLDLVLGDASVSAVLTIPCIGVEQEFKIEDRAIVFASVTGKPRDFRPGLDELHHF